MTTSWYRERPRVVQTILRTIDAPGYRAERYVDHCLRLNGNALVINAGGLFAFYPTEIAGHRRTPGLESDIVGDVVEAAHARGLRVLGRVDFRAGHEEQFAAEPDLFARDWNGAPVTTRGLYSAPATSPYRNDAFAFRVVRELLEKYDLDGIWENAPGFMQVWPGTATVKPYGLGIVQEHGLEKASLGLIDYSTRTRERFERDTGLRLPTPGDFDFGAYSAFMRWRTTVVEERTARMRALVESFGDKAYISEAGTQLDVHWGHGSGQNLEDVAPSWNLLASPTFDLIRGSRGSAFYPTPVWRAEESVKLMRASNRESAPAIMFGRFDNQSRFTTVAPAELAVQLAGSLANGGGFWECTFVGRETSEFLDRRCDAIVAHYYGLLRTHESDYRDQRPVAQVAVLFSRESEDWFGSSDPDADEYVQSTRGVLSALFSNHIPFEFVTTKTLTLSELNRFQVVVLPDAALLTDDACDVLREYVQGGGGLVSTYQTALFDERGRTRARSGLADVFGIEDTAGPSASATYAYGRISLRNALTAGLENTDIVTVEGPVQRITAVDGAEVPLRLIENVTPQPPELGWVEDMSGADPLIVTHGFGAGRSVYFAAQVDKLALTAGHPDYVTLLVNAIDWAGRDPRPIRIEAPASVHVSLMHQETSGDFSVHLVNYTNGPYRPIREIVPCHGIGVELPWTAAGPDSVRELTTGHELAFEVADGSLRFTLPRLDIYAAVRISAGRRP